MTTSTEHSGTSEHIFLSYSRADFAFAQTLKAALETAGHPVWMDTSEIKGGDEWINAITEGVNRCCVMLSLVSNASIDSKWVRREYLFAENKGKLVIPIWVEECEMPIYMVTLNALKGYAPHYEATLQAILRTLSDLAKIKVMIATPPDRRTLELDYLDRLWLENKIWLETYTPMAGVAQMQRKVKTDATRPVMITTNAQMEQVFRQRLRERKEHITEPLETEQRSYNDVLPAVEEMRQLVILGDPGAGKTTTLWRITASVVDKAIKDSTAPLPILVRLGELGSHLLEEQIRTQLGPLGKYYPDLLKQHRLVLLLDGLNELPSADENVRQAHMSEIKALVKYCQHEKMMVVVTCRELDYVGALDLGIAEQVRITPLDPVRIYRFVNAYLKEPPGIGDELFWQLAGQTAKNRWRNFAKEIEDDFLLFWLENDLPEGMEWGYTNGRWENWVKERQHPRSMMTLAGNPYMLYMMTQVFAEEGGHLPPNRGELFELFVDFLLLEREHLVDADADVLKNNLSELAYAMQKAGEGTSFDYDEALRHLGDRQNLYRAWSANLLGVGDIIRFTHQLLQEFFAARKMNTEMQKSVPAAHFWPAESWWEPHGWEETAILLAGLSSDDCTPVLKWLCEANPELTWRCINESGAHTPQVTIESFRPLWLPRLTDVKRDPKPQARAAIGRAVGYLKLDNRKGVGLRADGLPEFDWIHLPNGTFELGGDKESYDSLVAMNVTLKAFAIARYPVTYAQYTAFVTSDGYTNKDYWTDAGWDWKKETTQPAFWDDPQWHISNHPLVGVNWYESVAFCRWASAKLGMRIGLPTELEWERAACGTEKRFYAYGNEFDLSKANVSESGIGRTSAVGIFPATPEGVCDLSANVWEWTLTKWGDVNNNNTEGDARRVVRGGSWYDHQSYSRSASRYRYTPDLRYSLLGFRVVLRPL